MSQRFGANQPVGPARGSSDLYPPYPGMKARAVIENVPKTSIHSAGCDMD